MLLRELSKIAHHGAQEPLSLWMPEYDRIRLIFISQADAISGQLHHTQTHESWEQFLQLMHVARPQELQIVQAVQKIADILSTVPALETQPPELLAFVHDAYQFAALARKTAVAAEKRNTLKNTFAPDKQHAHDLQLFQGEGMWYCLEYYLEFYKRLTIAATLEEKKVLIEQKEIKMSFGNLPGLWHDFFQYEVLDKFIYSILNDDLRGRLTQVYFETRNAFLTIRASSEPDVMFRYDEISVDELVNGMRRLIAEMMYAYQIMGIDRLSSRAFTPYGFQPRLAEIAL